MALIIVGFFIWFGGVILMVSFGGLLNSGRITASDILIGVLWPVILIIITIIFPISLIIEKVGELGMEIDYRELLKKYIDHIRNIKGSVFLSDRYDRPKDLFTDEEWRELQKLDKEVCEECRAKLEAEGMQGDQSNDI